MRGLGKKKAPQQQPDTGAAREHVGAGQQNAVAGRQVVDAGRQGAGPGQLGSTGAIVAGRDVVNSATYSVQAEHTLVLPPQAFTPIPADAAGGGVSNVPESLFVGRTDELALLEEAFSREGEVVVHAVHGLGGIGKSALAAHWACRRGERVRWRITADSPAAVQAGLAELARILKPALGGLPEEQQAERVVQWLAGNRGWLLVLDNVEDPADIAPLLERVPRGRVLITTRRATGWHRHATTIRLGVLGEGDSVDLFVRVLTHNDPRESEGAGAVCEELGHLALAVEQAAAYCAQTGTVPSRYLEMLAEFPAAMLAAGTERTDSERTVTRIWRLTLDRLADVPLARDILRILAWYAPDRIPRYLLDPLDSPPEVAGAIGRLLAYNMITDNLDGTLSVHRLVQTLARTPDPGDPHRQGADIEGARTQATRLLSEALPEDVKLPAGWPRHQELSPHIDALADNHDPGHDTLTTADVLSRSAAFRLGHAGPTTAIRLFRRVLAAHERILESDHPEILASCYNLADAYDVMGYGGALPLYERVLAYRERVLGNNHPDTMTIRNTLSFAYSGDNPKAINLFKSILAYRERVLGKNHPDTMATRNTLANAYRRAGNLEHAINLYENVLNLNHPDTMATRNTLAFSYRVAGDLEQAINLYKSVLADRERVLGLNHPDTMATRNNLAFSYRVGGDLEQAISLFKSVLADRERVLGNDHPDTMVTRNNLAFSYQRACDLEQAISLYKSVLADRERVLGMNHPDTRATRNTLADAYRAVGDLERAIDLYESVLGLNHPDTMATRDNLIRWAVAVTDRGHTRLPGDLIGAWQDAGSVVWAIGPHLTDASLVYGPALSRAYLLAADILDADGQPEAAHEFRQRAANTA
ncbi:tetratricopeptide repeat protein [Kitasatospora indigofera]|uniref:tetratricopeptide repeat protein n=1 Tax=Kitasatospora indigofera TaxID=67307 RepID=UPI003665E3E1